MVRPRIGGALDDLSDSSGAPLAWASEPLTSQKSVSRRIIFWRLPSSISLEWVRGGLWKDGGRILVLHLIQRPEVHRCTCMLVEEWHACDTSTLVLSLNALDYLVSSAVGNETSKAEEAPSGISIKR